MTIKENCQNLYYHPCVDLKTIFFIIKTKSIIFLANYQHFKLDRQFSTYVPKTTLPASSVPAVSVTSSLYIFFPQFGSSLRRVSEFGILNYNGLMVSDQLIEHLCFQNFARMLGIVYMCSLSRVPQTTLPVSVCEQCMSVGAMCVTTGSLGIIVANQIQNLFFQNR